MPLTRVEILEALSSLTEAERDLIKFPIDRYSGPHLQVVQNRAVIELLRNVRGAKHILSQLLSERD